MKNDNTKKIDRLNKLTEVDFPKSKEDIWKLMEGKLTANAKEDKKVRKLGIRQLSIAASIAILIGIGSFMRFYRVDYSTIAGEQLTVNLPDGSVVDLNGQSSVKYNPYWWKVNRTVKFEGEGYFEVEKGKYFSVVSNNGITTVLGTSFNIYSRDENYEVNCLTGKVQVEVLNGLKEIIYPNQQAKLNNSQLVVSESTAIHSTDWRNNAFYFTSESVKRVFREIGIAYNITIDVQADEIYSGNFKKSDNIEDVLTIVCEPLNLKFVKQQSGGYIIKRI
ncbi:MAG: FecR family protein [Prolixibacteraceae bacterium]|nr:FecR family protein [Prolixibacteraceae bacterium]